MTVTREQAQMLTTLAIACRPYRAPTWDEPGVMAAIAKCRDWSLPEVALRVIVAAADREAQTPGVIASPGMAIPETKAPLMTPNTWDPDAVCTTCSKTQSVCEARVRFGDDDHVFVSRARNAAETARPPDAVARIVADLHERLDGMTNPRTTPTQPEHEAASVAAEEAGQ